MISFTGDMKTLKISPKNLLEIENKFGKVAGCKNEQPKISCVSIR